MDNANNAQLTSHSNELFISDALERADSLPLAEMKQNRLTGESQIAVRISNFNVRFIYCVNDFSNSHCV